MRNFDQYFMYFASKILEMLICKISLKKSMEIQIYQNEIERY